VSRNLSRPIDTESRKDAHMPKQKLRPNDDTICPTAEWMARTETEIVEAPRDGDWRERQRTTIRTVPKIATWHRYGWIDGEQAKALTQWLQAWETWGADHVKSNLDRSPRGSADSCRPERVALAGRRYSAIKLHVVGSVGPIVERTVWAWMRCDEKIDYGDELGVGRNEGVSRARSMVRMVAVVVERLMRENRT
jgi:hypothetical protein